MKPSILLGILRLALCSLVTVAGFGPTLTDAEEILYLSPSGNETVAGTLPAPNPEKSDGPLATFERPGTRRASRSPAVKPGIQAPNVIFIITDDQGYGDLGFTGNPYIKTPNIDQLRTQSTLLENYHVDPTCAPTRAALMTGRYSGRVGVWHTIMGRNLLRKREVTMAEIFAENGYATGLFGKWHLGDEYPYRPEDRGFQQTVYHKAGGLGQAPDYWGNDYFDDTYWFNGKLQRFEGYCTDVWFEEATKFIREKRDRPFFAYISTNSPHSPYNCPAEYEDPYKNNKNVLNAAFYGMITHIDQNVGKLMAFLEEEGLVENTVLIYTTDNGTAAGFKGEQGYDGGMSGKKGSALDGGHRVPFLIRWPKGGIEAGKSIKQLTAHMDILPTFIDLFRLKSPDIAFDGSSIAELLVSDGSKWTPRTLVVESQRVLTPQKWRTSSVMTDRWRLVNGLNLYDMEKDPRQKTDVSQFHPEVVECLRAEYETFWTSVSQDHHLVSRMVIGSDQAPVVSLSSHDWLTKQEPPWNQRHVLDGKKQVGAWALEVAQAGTYEISVRRWPIELDRAINAAKDDDFKQARLRVDDSTQTLDIPSDAKEVTFKVDLQPGAIELEPVFNGSDKSIGAYYAYITHRTKPGWQTPKGMGIPVYDPKYGFDYYGSKNPKPEVE